MLRFSSSEREPKAGAVMPDQQDKITICGPKVDGTYVVEFRTAAGQSLAISVARGETAVLEHFQVRMPHGLVVSDVQEPDTSKRPVSCRS
jgi:hypothetical protein